MDSGHHGNSEGSPFLGPPRAGYYDGTEPVEEPPRSVRSFSEDLIYRSEKERIRQKYTYEGKHGTRATTVWRDQWTKEGIKVRMKEYRGLDTVLLSKGDLLEKVQHNYASHRQKFEEAVNGYRDKAVQLLQDHVERILANAPEQVVVSLPWPEDHSEDYERVIEMLEWSEDDELELNEHQFATYVLDQWGWQAGFSETYAMYSGS